MLRESAWGHRKPSTPHSSRCISPDPCMEPDHVALSNPLSAVCRCRDCCHLGRGSTVCPKLRRGVCDAFHAHRISGRVLRSSGSRRRVRARWLRDCGDDRRRRPHHRRRNETIQSSSWRACHPREGRTGVSGHTASSPRAFAAGAEARAVAVDPFRRIIVADRFFRLTRSLLLRVSRVRRQVRVWWWRLERDDRLCVSGRSGGHRHCW